MPPYPAPPWHTHGLAVLVPHLVPVEAVELPSGLEPLGRLGHTPGLLAYVRYLPPSPLVYDELIWMPALTRACAGEHRARGWHVAVMYVDSDASLAAGRDLWRLPKTLARFDRDAEGVTVTAEDGTRLRLRYRALGPSIRATSRVSTLQAVPEGLVRFRGTSRGRVRAARVEVRDFGSTHAPWESFGRARALLGTGVLLEEARSVMHPPEWLGSLSGG